MIFLIEYEKSTGRLNVEAFEASQRDLAASARLKLEVHLVGQGLSHEVVLLEAESLEALRDTHSRYFKNVTDLVKVGRSEIPGEADGSPADKSKRRADQRKADTEKDRSKGPK